MSDSAAAYAMRKRENHILAAMDQPNRIERLKWLLAGPMPDSQTREYFAAMLDEEIGEKHDHGR